jgi:hypothetical protein
VTQALFSFVDTCPPLRCAHQWRGKCSGLLQYLQEPRTSDELLAWALKQGLDVEGVANRLAFLEEADQVTWKDGGWRLRK